MTIQPTPSLTICQPDVSLGDPHVWTDAKNRLSLRFSIYESLVQYGAGGAYCPGLARRWTLADDARTWTFHLRPDVHFHDGDRLNARDVVATLARVCAPDMPGEYGTQGLYASYLGGATFDVPDAHTVRLVTARPMADLLDLLVKLPIAPHDRLDSLADEPIGSGPYRFTGAGSDRVTMARFEQYWGDPPPAATLHWQAEPEQEARVAALLAGEADMVTNITADAVADMDDGPGVEIVAWESCLCVIFMLNVQNDGPCADRRVRQALNYAADVPALIERVKGGAAQPLNGPLTPHHFGYDPATRPYTHDPERARQLLAEAGYGGGLALAVDVPTRHPDEAPQLARCLAEQYAPAGIELQVRTHADRPAYAQMVKAKAIGDACCFDSSPLSTYRCLREKFHAGVAGPWWQGYENPAVDRLLEDAWATVDDGQRQALYRRAYRLIRDDAPWLFLYRPTRFWGVGPRARGWQVGVDELVRV